MGEVLTNGSRVQGARPGEVPHDSDPPYYVMEYLETIREDYKYAVDDAKYWRLISEWEKRFEERKREIETIVEHSGVRLESTDALRDFLVREWLARNPKRDHDQFHREQIV